MNFLHANGRFTPTDENAVALLSKLPPALYDVQLSKEGYFLTVRDEMPLPSKLYGDTTARSSRILDTYRDRLKRGLSTGVLLAGEKGSGKTLLARKISADSGLPTLVVQYPFHDPSFKELIAGAGEAIVLFDEFEKVYANKDAQNGLLSLLDGIYDTRALFVATLNHEGDLVDAVRNRPSRFYYYYPYSGLSREFIDEYARDVLVDQSEERLRGLTNLTVLFPDINFDMLQAIVEEMNRYGESAPDVTKHLNVRTAFLSEYSTYKLSAFLDKTGEPVKLNRNSVKLQGHPLRLDSFMVYFALTPKQRKVLGGDNAPGYTYIYPQTHLTEADKRGDSFTFVSDPFRVVAERDFQSYGMWNPDGSMMRRRAPTDFTGTEEEEDE